MSKLSAVLVIVGISEISICNLYFFKTCNYPFNSSERFH